VFSEVSQIVTAMAVTSTLAALLVTRQTLPRYGQRLIGPRPWRTRAGRSVRWLVIALAGLAARQPLIGEKAIVTSGDVNLTGIGGAHPDPWCATARVDSRVWTRSETFWSVSDRVDGGGGEDETHFVNIATDGALEGRDCSRTGGRTAIGAVSSTRWVGCLRT
jgi:hypothetical protein